MILIYNWFSKRYIQLVLIFYMLAQYIGFVIPVPVLENTEVFTPKPIVFFIFGASMFIFAIIDYFTFAFHPLQKNILLEQELPFSRPSQFSYPLSPKSRASRASVVTLETYRDMQQNSPHYNILDNSSAGNDPRYTSRLSPSAAMANSSGNGNY